MAARVTAGEQLDRLLYILPVAAREGGCRLDELADTLGTTVKQVVRDLEEVTARSYYHRAGGDDLQIMIEGDRVRIWTTGEFRRPLRLTPLEGLALSLGFRVLAAEAEPARRARLLQSATQIETKVPKESAGQLAQAIAIDPGERGSPDVLSALRQAVRERRQCRIEYLKPSESSAEARTIHPYSLLRSGSGWYAVGHCAARGDVRAFRVDRMLSATLLTDPFILPPDFDPDDWVANGGRVYRAEEETEVVVRYSARIARWIREKGPVEEAGDGSVVVRYRVADPDWVVRHTLQHGVDAEILAPASARASVIAMLRRIGEGLPAER